MTYYTKKDIENLKGYDDEYYVPNALFDTMEYKLVRLEVKWGFVALLNALLQSPLYDNDGNGYIKDDNPSTIEILKNLAHKAVNQEKMDGYISELEESGLLERNGRNIYLKKINTIF
ncbi:MAG: hypothetical protein LUG60_11415 [Erysipelotrichaceae bacterium]|nr:hypothetical protein [Erysipelotrichaceae bacterium]